MSIRTREDTSAKIESEMLEREAAFIEYVQTKIDEVKKYTSLGKDGMLTFFDLNRALSEFQNINLMLISLYSITKNENLKAAEEFEDWYAKCYVNVRDVENPKSVSPGKWASAKEIEMIVRTTYADEFKRRKHELNLKETHLSFLRRMCDAWGSQQFILTQLSKNLIAEVGGLNTTTN